jgi:hypothetical protein
MAMARFLSGAVFVFVIAVWSIELQFICHIADTGVAERERFELSVLAYTRVPGVHLKPLGHLSAYCEINGKS